MARQPCGIRVAALVEPDGPLHILVRVETEVLTKPPTNGAPRRRETRCFAFKSLRCLNRAGSAHTWALAVARSDPKRQTLKDRAQGGTKTAEVISVAVTESDVCHRTRDYNQFRVEAFLF